MPVSTSRKAERTIEALQQCVGDSIELLWSQCISMIGDSRRGTRLLHSSSQLVRVRVYGEDGILAGEDGHWRNWRNWRGVTGYCAQACGWHIGKEGSFHQDCQIGGICVQSQTRAPNVHARPLSFPALRKTVPLVGCLARWLARWQDEAHRKHPTDVPRYKDRQH